MATRRTGERTVDDVGRDQSPLAGAAASINGRCGSRDAGVRGIRDARSIGAVVDAIATPAGEQPRRSAAGTSPVPARAAWRPALLQKGDLHSDDKRLSRRHKVILAGNGKYLHPLDDALRSPLRALRFQSQGTRS